MFTPLYSVCVYHRAGAVARGSPQCVCLLDRSPLLRAAWRLQPVVRAARRRAPRGRRAGRAARGGPACPSVRGLGLAPRTAPEAWPTPAAAASPRPAACCMSGGAPLRVAACSGCAPCGFVPRLMSPVLYVCRHLPHGFYEDQLRGSAAGLCWRRLLGLSWNLGC